MFGEGHPRVFAHQVIQVLTLPGGMHFGKVAARHAPQEPFLQQQALGRGRVVLALHRQGLQQPGLLLRIVDPVQQRLAALFQQALDLPALEPLPRFQCRWQRPLLGLPEQIVEVGAGQFVDAHQHGTGIVLAAGPMRGLDQGQGGVFQ